MKHKISMDAASMDAAQPPYPDDPPPDMAAGGESIATEDLVTLSESARHEIERFRRAHETKVLTIFFSDLVGSTQLQVEQGNVRAAQLVHEHYAIMRQALAGFDGKEISTAGDSMLIVFAAPADAVQFALHAQQAMRRGRAQAPLLPTMRCGIHQGQVVLQKEPGKPEFTDVYGVQVSMAARIMSLAQCGQILISRAVFDDARTILVREEFVGFGEIAWANHGAYRFKGFREECDVCEVGEQGSAPMAPPPASGKAWPVHAARESQASDGNLPAAPSAAGRARHRWGVVAALLLIAAAVTAGTLAIRRPSQPKPPATTDADSLTDPIRRLAQIESTLAKLSGVDEELQAMGELDKNYRAATQAIFGTEPDQVRSESLQFLARLRAYDLTEEEQALVAKADAQAASRFVLYPEEIYNPVRQLAERLVARKKALRREQEHLQASLVRSIP